MVFRTEINPKPSKHKIQIQDYVLLMGSCFSENIGHYLQNHLFDVSINPFGTVYNPASIAQLLHDVQINKKYNSTDLIYSDELYHSLYHHSCFSSLEAQKTLDQIHQSNITTHHFIKKSSWVFITLGSAWIYEFLENGHIVSNCHKIPAKKFTKKLLSVAEITTQLENLISSILGIQADANIVFTLSPVRHSKDGWIENQQSKSSLHIAIQKVLQTNKVMYFPAYEIMMDDLRDYRFYEADLIHPNAIALEYIWQKFQDVFFDQNTRVLCESIGQVKQKMNHKPRSKETTAYQLFSKSLQDDIQRLSDKIGKNIMESML